MKRLNLFFLLFATLLMTGCVTVQPSDLGISPQVWNQYTKEQRDEMASNYHEIELGRVENGLKGTLGGDKNSILNVQIHSGKAMMPPFTQLQYYQPLSFSIHQGECYKRIPVYQSNDPKKQVILAACYRDDILYLDPSRYDKSKRYGSLEFTAMPLWRRGFTYPNVSSSGLVRFTHVNITITETKNE